MWASMAQNKQSSCHSRWRTIVLQTLGDRWLTMILWDGRRQPYTLDVSHLIATASKVPSLFHIILRHCGLRSLATVKETVIVVINLVRLCSSCCYEPQCTHTQLNLFSPSFLSWHGMHEMMYPPLPTFLYYKWQKLGRGPGKEAAYLNIAAINVKSHISISLLAMLISSLKELPTTSHWSLHRMDYRRKGTQNYLPWQTLSTTSNSSSTDLQKSTCTNLYHK